MAFFGGSTYIVLGKIRNLLRQIFYVLSQDSNDVNGQILNKLFSHDLVTLRKRTKKLFCHFSLNKNGAEKPIWSLLSFLELRARTKVFKKVTMERERERERKRGVITFVIEKWKKTKKKKLWTIFNTPVEILSWNYFFKNGSFPGLFLVNFSHFQQFTVNACYLKIHWKLNSNLLPLG